MAEPPIGLNQLFPARGSGATRRFHGLFRGQVKKRDDRELENKYLGRMRVWVPQVHGEDYEDKIEDLPWAWPAFALAGKDGDTNYGSFCLPPDDAWVYVLFENGDPDRPVWFGAWYGEKDGETELPESFIEDDRSSARYPDLIGWVSPWEGKIIVRVLKSERCEVIYGDPEDPDAIAEFDSVGYPPNEGDPTVRIETKWKVKIKAAENIEAETEKTFKVTCDKFEVTAESEISMESEGSSIYKASGTNTFEGSQIKGKGTPSGGFDLYGTTRRSPSSLEE